MWARHKSASSAKLAACRRQAAQKQRDHDFQRTTQKRKYSPRKGEQTNKKKKVGVRQRAVEYGVTRLRRPVRTTAGKNDVAVVPAAFCYGADPPPASTAFVVAAAVVVVALFAPPLFLSGILSETGQFLLASFLLLSALPSLACFSSRESLLQCFIFALVVLALFPLLSLSPPPARARTATGCQWVVVGMSVKTK